MPEDKRAALTALWRDKQLQYTWLRSLQDRYADFWQVTGDALDFALDSLGLAEAGLTRAADGLYRGLDAFPEVPEVLRRCARPGSRRAILSNGSPAMLEALVSRARLADCFDAVLSVDAVGVFKTHPKVYQYALDRLGLPARRDLVPVLQRLGRLCRLGFRHARRLVQPLWPAARAPARRARFRDQDARGAAAAARALKAPA